LKKLAKMRMKERDLELVPQRTVSEPQAQRNRDLELGPQRTVSETTPLLLRGPEGSLDLSSSHVPSDEEDDEFDSDPDHLRTLSQNCFATGRRPSTKAGGVPFLLKSNSEDALGGRGSRWKHQNNLMIPSKLKFHNFASADGTIRTTSTHRRSRTPGWRRRMGRWRRLDEILDILPEEKDKVWKCLKRLCEQLAADQAEPQNSRVLNLNSASGCSVAQVWAGLLEERDSGFALDMADITRILEELVDTGWAADMCCLDTAGIVYSASAKLIWNDSAFKYLPGCPSDEKKPGGWIRNAAEGMMDSEIIDTLENYIGQRCPKGHLLKKKVLESSEDCPFCDGCGHNIRAGVEISFCEECSWHNCSHCISKEKNMTWIAVCLRLLFVSVVFVCSTTIGPWIMTLAHARGEANFATQEIVIAKFIGTTVLSFIWMSPADRTMLYKKKFFRGMKYYAPLALSMLVFNICVVESWFFVGGQVASAFMRLSLASALVADFLVFGHRPSIAQCGAVIALLISLVLFQLPSFFNLESSFVTGLILMLVASTLDACMMCYLEFLNKRLKDSFTAPQRLFLWSILIPPMGLIYDIILLKSNIFQHWNMWSGIMSVSETLSMFFCFLVVMYSNAIAIQALCVINFLAVFMVVSITVTAPTIEQILIAIVIAIQTLIYAWEKVFTKPPPEFDAEEEEQFDDVHLPEKGGGAETAAGGAKQPSPPVERRESVMITPRGDHFRHLSNKRNQRFTK